MSRRPWERDLPSEKKVETPEAVVGPPQMSPATSSNAFRTLLPFVSPIAPCDVASNICPAASSAASCEPSFLASNGTSWHVPRALNPGFLRHMTPYDVLLAMSARPKGEETAAVSKPAAAEPAAAAAAEEDDGAADVGKQIAMMMGRDAKKARTRPLPRVSHPCVLHYMS